VHLSDSFDIDCPGQTGFAPFFTAGLADPVAGRFSPFQLELTRRDREQFIDGLNVELPKGLLAKVKGVSLCGDRDASVGTCPAASRVGGVTVDAGPGERPFSLGGTMYLTEGYKGAPYGLSIVVRAIAGPLDLGTVVVRQAVWVDPTDAHLTAVSDPLPTILEGIPLRLRTVRVNVDRPAFTVGPTSCAEQSVKGLIHSQQGASASVASRFQVGDCRSLPFKPALAMRLRGRRESHVGGHPGLSVMLRQAPGEANLQQVSARLPLSLALDPDNAQTLCEYDDGLRKHCPKGSIIGRAVADSPLLPRPLSGPVYFVKGIRFGKNGRRIRTLPTLLIPLEGNIAIDLRAKSSVVGGHLVTTFSGLPDAAITRVRLSLLGGRHGILAVTGTRGLCSARQLAGIQIDGQNGKRADQTISMRTPCPRSH
jgi:hypothetical protein